VLILHCSGYVGPGGLHEHGLHYNCTGGAAGYIDKVVLTTSHIFNWPTPKVLVYCRLYSKQYYNYTVGFVVSSEYPFPAYRLNHRNRLTRRVS
jgi:hypothetical protein